MRLQPVFCDTFKLYCLSIIQETLEGKSIWNDPPFAGTEKDTNQIVVTVKAGNDECTGDLVDVKDALKRRPAWEDSSEEIRAIIPLSRLVTVNEDNCLLPPKDGMYFSFSPATLPLDGCEGPCEEISKSIWPKWFKLNRSDFEAYLKKALDLQIGRDIFIHCKTNILSLIKSLCPRNWLMNALTFIRKAGFELTYTQAGLEMLEKHARAQSCQKADHGTV